VRDFDSFPNGICKVSAFFDDTFDECLMNLKCRKQNGQNQIAFRKCVLDSSSTAGFDFKVEMTTKRDKDHFHLIPAMSESTFTFDWTNLPPDMKYMEHFALKLYQFGDVHGVPAEAMDTGIIYDPDNIDMKENYGSWFYAGNVSKRDVLKFSVRAVSDVWVQWKVLILHGAFIENKNYTAFWNTMTLTSSRPERADLGEKILPKTFLAMLPNVNDKIARPLNVRHWPQENSIGEVSWSSNPHLNFVSTSKSAILVPQSFEKVPEYPGRPKNVTDTTWNKIFPRVRNINSTFLFLCLPIMNQIKHSLRFLANSILFSPLVLESPSTRTPFGLRSHLSQDLKVQFAYSTICRSFRHVRALTTRSSSSSFSRALIIALFLTQVMEATLVNGLRLVFPLNSSCLRPINVNGTRSLVCMKNLWIKMLVNPRIGSNYRPKTRFFILPKMHTHLKIISVCMIPSLEPVTNLIRQSKMLKVFLTSIK